MIVVTVGTGLRVQEVDALWHVVVGSETHSTAHWAHIEHFSTGDVLELKDDGGVFFSVESGGDDGEMSEVVAGAPPGRIFVARDEGEGPAEPFLHQGLTRSDTAHKRIVD